MGAPIIRLHGGFRQGQHADNLVVTSLKYGHSSNYITMGWLRLVFWASMKFNFDVQSVYVNDKNNVIYDNMSRLDKF